MLNGNDGEKKNKRTFKGKSLSMIEIEMMNQKINLNKNAYDIEMAKGRERPRVIKNLSKGRSIRDNGRTIKTNITEGKCSQNKICIFIRLSCEVLLLFFPTQAFLLSLNQHFLPLFCTLIFTSHFKDRCLFI